MDSSSMQVRIRRIVGATHAHPRIIPFAALLVAACMIINSLAPNSQRQPHEQTHRRPIRHLVQSMIPFTLTCATSTLEFTSSLDLPCKPRLSAGRPIRLSIPSVRTYWSASLHEPLTDTIVPVYRSFHGTEEGWFIVPFAAEWRLVVRAPELLPDIDTDIEPSWCMGVLSGGPDKQGLNQSSSVFPAGWTYCRIDEPNGPEFATNPPRTRAPEESVIIRRPLTFVDAPPGRGGLAQTTELMASSVYGPYTKALAKHGAVAIGFWQPRKTAVGPPQTLDYQPEPSGCPQSFMGGVHQENCKYALPTYAWHPLSRQAEKRILTPTDLASCANKRRFLVIGDSLGHALFRGMACGASGYAQLDDPDRLVHAIHHAVTLLPLFAPLDMRLDMLYADFLVLLGTHQGDAAEYVWHFGTWMVSYVPSGSWRRGLRRLAQFCHRHSHETGAVHHFTLATAPHWEPATMPNLVEYGPRWQTVSRAFAWNKLVLEMAERYDFDVVDLFTPTSARLDSRTDNVHFCDGMSYELGHMVFSAPCEGSSYSS